MLTLGWTDQGKSIRRAKNMDKRLGLTNKVSWPTKQLIETSYYLSSLSKKLDQHDK